MKVIVTGGTGFIGTNAAARFLSRGHTVIAFDNLSRTGAADNLAWLQTRGGDFHFVRGDIRDAAALAELLADHADAGALLHLAAQVAVTTSVANPREDFEINALGTLNVLEAVRLSQARPLVLYSSTNKVYGGMQDVAVAEDETRYRYRDLAAGIAEARPLDFHSPYGCSKGAGDQYVRDYCRIYGIPSVVLRQSCIYGPRQLGVEDQGWVAWFIIAAVLGRPMTIYGDGKQIRDLLYIDDLIDLYETCIANRDACTGRIYNVGGGPPFTLSVWREFGPLLEDLLGRKLSVDRGDWRPGDQRVYVSNIDKVRQELGWKPAVAPREGIRRLYKWVEAHRDMLEKLF